MSQLTGHARVLTRHLSLIAESHLAMRLRNQIRFSFTNCCCAAVWSLMAQRRTPRIAATRRYEVRSGHGCDPFQTSKMTLCKNSAQYNCTRNFGLRGDAAGRKTEKFVFRSALRPNPISFVNSQDPSLPSAAKFAVMQNAASTTECDMVVLE